MIGDAPESRNRLDRHESGPASLALVGAVAVAVGWAAFWAWPARRSEHEERRDALVAYLRDHLSGSDMGVRVVERLASMPAIAGDRPLFTRLTREFEEERFVVRSLLAQLGASGRSMKRAASYTSAAVLSLSAGGEPGDLSLFRTLEGLAVGIQGKRCMWRALDHLAIALPSSTDMTFVDLEAQAVRQWEAIEDRRRSLATRTFA